MFTPEAAWFDGAAFDGAGSDGAAFDEAGFAPLRQPGASRSIC